jgi:hypothetical protein
VAGSLGYCGLDRRRQALVGDEIRPCWEAWPAGADPTVTPPLMIVSAAEVGTAPVRAERLEFVEVRARPTAGTVPVATEPAASPPGSIPPSIAPRDQPGWSLWGDLEG